MGYSIRKKASVLLFLVTLFFIVSEEMIGVEARTCASASGRFNGLCARSSNCASVCHSEGFPDGQCQGVRRRCMCLKPC